MTLATHHPTAHLPDRPPYRALLRALPQVQKLMESEAARELMARFPRTAVVDAIRDALEVLRRAVLAGDASLDGLSPDELAGSLFEMVRAALEPTRHRYTRGVINGTGIIIHTNLGRAPLAEPATAAVI